MIISFFYFTNTLLFFTWRSIQFFLQIFLRKSRALASKTLPCLYLSALFLIASSTASSEINELEAFNDPASWEASIEALEARQLGGDLEALLILASIYCHTERWYSLKNLLAAMKGKAYLRDARFYFEGRIALAENRLGSARSAFEDALRSNPEPSRSIRAQLFFYQAICFLKLKQNERAKEAFEKALAADFLPESRAEIINLAQFYARFQTVHKTISWFNSIPQEIRDSEAELSAILGRAYLRASYPFLAIKAFSQSLCLEPGQASLLTLRASAYRSVGDLSSAESDIEEAIALDPLSNRSEQDYLYGLILFEAGKLDRAYAIFSQRYSQRKESETDTGFFLLHAQLAYTVGAMEEAQESLETFFSLEKGVINFNAHALALILRLPELGIAPLDDRVIPFDAPAIFELSLLKNHLEGRNSLAYLIGQSDSASLTFFLAQIEKARDLKQSQARLLEETMLRTSDKTPEYLGAVWQLKELEN